jgi:hypothetical protein
MGTDIYGWLQVSQTPGYWIGALDAGVVLERDYDVFGCLFGVRNYANFAPLFADRGAPPDSDIGEGCNGLTWATYDELKRIPLDEAALAQDARIGCYEVDASGNERRTGKGAWSGAADPHLARIDAGESVRVGNQIFRRGTLTRRDALGTRGFRILMDVAEIFAREYGAENVRLVVWFDD